MPSQLHLSVCRAKKGRFQVLESASASLFLVLATFVVSIPSGALFAQQDSAATLESFRGEADDVPPNYDHSFLLDESTAPERNEPIELGKGPHLFLDNHLIDSSQGLTRVVNHPKREPSLSNPIVTGKEDGCFQPYLSVLRDPDTGIFRLWFGHRTEDMDSSKSRIGYMESKDGLHWDRPARLLEDPGPIQFGVAVIDRGSSAPAPEGRYVYAWYKGNGTFLATSPDGLDWTMVGNACVLRHSHDISGLHYDPARKEFVATLSVYRTSDFWEGKRRVTMHSKSPDLVHWGTPHYVIMPRSDRDQGETQFYAMDGYLTRGDLTVGMVKVLRDDLKADTPPDPSDAYGLGYTTLAWTRDGINWTRDPEPFFDRNPEKGTWDRAHAWIDEQLPVGDEVYLYYGGYARGHKVNRFEERQIGLVKIRQDRYVARRAGEKEGRLVTPRVVLGGDSLSLNVEAAGGSVRARVLNEAGVPIPGFDFPDFKAITADSLQAPLEWKGDLSELRDKPVRLEFSMTNAGLYAIQVD